MFSSFFCKYALFYKTIKKVFFLIGAGILILIDIIRIIQKKKFKNWNQRNKNNEIYSYFDFIVKDFKNIKFIDFFCFIIIYIICKIITIIQLIIAIDCFFILIYKIILNKKIIIREKKNIWINLFIINPFAISYLIIIKFFFSQIRNNEIKKIITNLFFLITFGISKRNIVNSIIIHNHIKSYINNFGIYFKKKKCIENLIKNNFLDNISKAEEINKKIY